METQTYHLHEIPVIFHTDDAILTHRLRRYWRAFRGNDDSRTSALHIHLQVSDAPPARPDLPVASFGPEVTYFLEGQRLVILYHNWARFDVQLDKDVVHGVMLPQVARHSGAVEDMILIALAPLLRRRGYFTLHAFAAARDGRALLLLGDIGAGKTTTGLSLLANGAQLVANDSPLLRIDETGQPQLFAYPGLISAYPDSLAYFPEIQARLHAAEPHKGEGKLSFAADDIWPDAWAWQARPAALLFPQITPGLEESRLEPISAFQALQYMVGQSLEDWDKATIPAHLRAIRQLTASAPAYRLLLAPDVSRLPQLLMPLFDGSLADGQTSS